MEGAEDETGVGRCCGVESVKSSPINGVGRGWEEQIGVVEEGGGVGEVAGRGLGRWMGRGGMGAYQTCQLGSIVSTGK